MSTQDDFYSRLKTIFKESGKTQQQFSEETGINRNTLAAYLSGRAIPSIDIIAKLCTAFSISADWLLGLSDTRLADANMAMAASVTGFSDEAIKVLCASGGLLSQYSRDVPLPRDGGISVALVNLLLTTKKGRDLLRALGLYVGTNFINHKYVRQLGEDGELAPIPSELVENGALYTVMVRARSLRQELQKKEG